MIDVRQLGVSIIACLRAVTHRQISQFGNMGVALGGWVMVVGLPQAKMSQYLLNDLVVLYH